MQACNAGTRSDFHSPDRLVRRSFSSLLRTIFLLWLLAFGIAPLNAALAADAGAANAPLSKQEAQQLLNVLNDPQKRSDFTKTLSLMAKGVDATGTVAPPAVTKPAAAAQPAVVTPNAAALQSDFASSVSSIKSRFRDYLDNFLGLFSDLKSVGHWFRGEISNPQSREILIDTFWRAGLIILVAMASEWAISLLIRKPLHRVTARAQLREHRLNATSDATPSADPTASATPAESTPAKTVDAKDVAEAQAAGASKDEIATLQTRANDQQRQIDTLRFITRVPYALGHFGLKLLPILLFLGVAFAGSALATGTSQAETVTETLAEAYVVARILFILVESALAPRSPTIRLAPVSDSTARMLTHWWNVLVAAPSIVVCLSVLGGEFDMSARGTEAMIRAVVLVEHILIAGFIWRLRPIVARTIAPKRAKAKTGFWSFMLALAEIWWIPALFLDVALWLVWAVHMRGGYDWILRTVVLTVVIIALSRLLAILCYGWQDKLFRLNPELVQKHPDLQARADRYYPFVRGTLTGIIAFVSFLALTESWGIDSVHFFFTNSLGSRLLGAAVTLIVAVAFAAAIWEFVNVLLNRQLEQFDKSGQSTRATRLKTVLPIIRTVLLFIIIIIVLVTSLSQLGINVAPLLTGAGIMGAAIAFGSQSLVKDFITGFFMLVEDAIQVGDWVTAGGVAGIVENISIRTVRVRAFDGDLHIIPFSSVSSIANTARGWNQIIINQTVDLGENIPRVVKIMADTVKEMREEEAFKTIIYSDYNDLGVNSTTENGSIIIGTIRTAAMMKWKVQREFYKRIANRMAAAGVKFYTPTSYTASAPGTALNITGAIKAPAATTAANEDTPAPTSSETKKPKADEPKGHDDET
ncbi:mechanosensitive ion channel family protein [Acetobacter sp.]|uniref:mechanosensitive ion channel family protein n=1 Tax=Acetobacter sp. TaxID=440 RepID=UPI0039EC6B46